MILEDYKNIAKQEQHHQDEIMRLEKEAQDWQAKSCESAKEIITLNKERNKRKEISVRAFIKQKSKQEELEYTERGNDIILSITGTPTENLCFRFNFSDKRNEFTIVQDGRITKMLAFTYHYADYPKFSDEVYSDTGSMQDKVIRDKKATIEISKKQIERDKAEKEFICSHDLFIKIQSINHDCNKLYSDEEFWEEIFKTQ
ncbi:hypothetical protein [Treponema sp. OMZ 857]|uniref:hypothetical protein n=1 Tax=Treponema sp. OMZ 857 TaxID=1643513 RepID=UPI0020A5CF13|nr:hypothetical protein [Treponema sp. OMZ 857]UTC44571.1 hypothetical protein E4N66_11115 [Treponema sp. OMZ 857]